VYRQLTAKVLDALRKEHALVDSEYQRILHLVKRRTPEKSSAEQELIAAVRTILSLKEDEAASQAFYTRVLEEQRQGLNTSNLWTSKSWPKGQTDMICTTYLPLIAMNRFARVVAVLNWAKATSGKALPTLPQWVQPVWHRTPDTFQFEEDPYFALMR
jgi:hypothetical protein